MAEENQVFVQWMLPHILNVLHGHISKGKLTIWFTGPWRKDKRVDNKEFDVNWDRVYNLKHIVCLNLFKH